MIMLVMVLEVGGLDADRFLWHESGHVIAGSIAHLKAQIYSVRSSLQWHAAGTFRRAFGTWIVEEFWDHYWDH